MRTYPAGFEDVRDVTLRIPYYRNTWWPDQAYSVKHAAELGRFDGVTRVWLIELDGQGIPGAPPDEYGLAPLRALGLAETGRRIETHRSVIVELTRPAG
jgi:mannosyltransferase